MKCGATWLPNQGESLVTVQDHACALEMGHAGHHKCKFQVLNRGCCDWPREPWEPSAHEVGDEGERK
jgi:hypothetical protein